MLSYYATHTGTRPAGEMGEIRRQARHCRGRLRSQTIDLYGILKDYPRNTSIDRNHLLLNQNFYPSFHIEDHVLGVNLENNSLETLEAAQLPPDLIEIYLSNNNLKDLPDSILDNQLSLTRVSLSGNPWSCDCNALKFKKWLTSKSHIIQDIEDVRCGVNDNGDSRLNGRVIWTLSDLDLCPQTIGLIISLSIGILIVMTFCLSIQLLYNKYNLNIKLFLYSHGFTFVKEEDLDHDKEFDAFISYCHKDVEFVVKEIISVIEVKDPDIRLCIHSRDFRAGEFIYDNIVWAVGSSKRTVLILSKNFLESEWCLQEFRTAHTQALEDKVHRLVVIKVGDLPKELDPVLKVYLDSTTYLTWGESHFWKKLLYILPTGSSVQNNREDIGTD